MGSAWVASLLRAVRALGGGLEEIMKNDDRAAGEYLEKIAREVQDVARQMQAVADGLKKQA